MINLSEDLQLAAIRHSGYDLRHIKNPTEAVQLACVMDQPSSLTQIKNPTKKVIRAAIEEARRIMGADHVVCDTKTGELFLISLHKDGQTAIINCRRDSISTWLELSDDAILELGGIPAFRVKDQIRDILKRYT